MSEHGETVSHPSDTDKRQDPMAAIREAVEAKQQSLADIDTDIMDLEDVVWRSPARPVVDPTDIITRLAEEADKVARGVADAPPPATVYRARSEPDFGTRRQVAAHHLAKRPPATTATDVATEERIRHLVTAALEAEGRISPDGKISMSEDELRKLVRTQIDTVLAQQLGAGQQDTLHSQPEMRTNAARKSDQDPE